MLIMSIMMISGQMPRRGINIKRMTKIVLMYAVMISISVTEGRWPGLRGGIGLYGGIYELRPITLFIETYINIIGLGTMVIGGEAKGGKYDVRSGQEASKRGARRGVDKGLEGEAGAWPIMGLIICLGMSSIISSNEIISIIIGIE